MPDIAKKVAVDRRTGKVYVDDQELPWMISAETGVTVQVGDPMGNAVSTVVVGILADDVEVIPATGQHDPAEVRTVLADVYRKVLDMAGVEPDQATIDRLVAELLPDVEVAFLQYLHQAGQVPMEQLLKQAKESR